MKRLIRVRRNGFTGKLALDGPKWATAVAGCVTIHNSVGLLVNWRAFWVGAHYSKTDKRLCLNLIPCVTLWWTKPGGRLP